MKTTLWLFLKHFKTIFLYWKQIFFIQYILITISPSQISHLNPHPLWLSLENKHLKDGNKENKDKQTGIGQNK